MRKYITDKIYLYKTARRAESTKFNVQILSAKIAELKEVRNELDKTSISTLADLDHYCTYNGINGDNKKELLEIICKL